jgi:hypothetical protein
MTMDKPAAFQRKLPLFAERCPVSGFAQNAPRIDRNLLLTLNAKGALVFATFQVIKKILRPIAVMPAASI